MSKRKRSISSSESESSSDEEHCGSCFRQSWSLDYCGVCCGGNRLVCPNCTRECVVCGKRCCIRCDIECHRCGESACEGCYGTDSKQRDRCTNCLTIKAGKKVL